MINIEFLNKRWDLPTMERRMENLKKVIPENEVENTITAYSQIAEDRLDVLYLAYFNLKDRFCKIDRNKFGEAKIIAYRPKVRVIYYDSSCATTANNWEYNWTTTSASYDNFVTTTATTITASGW